MRKGKRLLLSRHTIRTLGENALVRAQGGQMPHTSDWPTYLAACTLNACGSWDITVCYQATCVGDCTSSQGPF